MSHSSIMKPSLHRLLESDFRLGLFRWYNAAFSLVMEAIYEMFLLEPQFSRVFLNRLLGRINEVRISWIPSVSPQESAAAFFFPFGLPVRWMILHLWIRKSTEICFRSRPWRPWVSWVLETRRFCCIGCESNVRKVYIFREANMNHKNNSYLRISTYMFVAMAGKDHSTTKGGVMYFYMIFRCRHWFQNVSMYWHAATAGVQWCWSAWHHLQQGSQHHKMLLVGMVPLDATGMLFELGTVIWSGVFECQAFQFQKRVWTRQATTTRGGKSARHH